MRDATRFNVEQFAPLLQWKVFSSRDVLIYIGRQLGLQLGNSYASIPFNSYRGYNLVAKVTRATCCDVEGTRRWCCWKDEGWS